MRKLKLQTIEDKTKLLKVSFSIKVFPSAYSKKNIRKRLVWTLQAIHVISLAFPTLIYTHFQKMILEPTWNMLILVFESIVYEFCRPIVSQMRDLPGHARGYGDTHSFLTHPVFKSDGKTGTIRFKNFGKVPVNYG